MSNKNSNAASSGIGFSGLLGIAFIVLKLTKVIAWKWIWVLAPLWIPLSILIILVIVYLLIDN